MKLLCCVVLCCVKARGTEGGKGVQEGKRTKDEPERKEQD